MTAARPELPWMLLAGLRLLDDPASRRRSARDWAVDSAIAAFGGTMTFLLMAILLDGEHTLAPTAAAIDIGLGWLSMFALWWRRRLPVTLAVVLLPVAVVSMTATIAIMVALFTVAVHRRWPVAALVGVLHFAASIGFSLWRPDEDIPFWILQALVAAVYGMTIAWGMFARARRQLVLSLHERAQRAEAEQHLRVEQARQHERTRIAREMHDVLAHRISLVSLHAGALEFRPDAPADEVAAAAGVIRTSAHQALEDLREVIGVLRGGDTEPEPDRPQPTLGDLEALVEESHAAGARIRLDGRVEQAPPVGLGRTAYRIVQEGLTNARKHAPGAAIDVLVDGGPDVGLTVEVRNRRPVGSLGAAPGSGAAGSGSSGSRAPGAAGSRASGAGIPGAGLGLVGLRERAALAGGHLEAGITDDGDFRLHVWLPWPAVEA